MPFDCVADAIDPERALCARLTYADVGLLFDRRGQLRSVQELPDTVRAAIVSIEATTEPMTKAAAAAQPRRLT